MPNSFQPRSISPSLSTWGPRLHPSTDYPAPCRVRTTPHWCLRANGQRNIRLHSPKSARGAKKSVEKNQQRLAYWGSCRNLCWCLDGVCKLGIYRQAREAHTIYCQFVTFFLTDFYLCLGWSFAGSQPRFQEKIWISEKSLTPTRAIALFAVKERSPSTTFSSLCFFIFEVPVEVSNRQIWYCLPIWGG